MMRKLQSIFVLLVYVLFTVSAYANELGGSLEEVYSDPSAGISTRLAIDEYEKNGLPKFMTITFENSSKESDYFLWVRRDWENVFIYVIVGEGVVLHPKPSNDNSERRGHGQNEPNYEYLALMRGKNVSVQVDLTSLVNEMDFSEYDSITVVLTGRFSYTSEPAVINDSRGHIRIRYRLEEIQFSK